MRIWSYKNEQYLSEYGDSSYLNEFLVTSIRMVVAHEFFANFLMACAALRERYRISLEKVVKFQLLHHMMQRPMLIEKYFKTFVAPPSREFSIVIS